MKAFACTALILAVHFPGFAQDTRPTFGEPRFPASKKCSLTFAATRAPGNQVLSILRTVQDKNERDFLAVGGAYGKRAETQCTLEVVFEASLPTQEVLSVDVRTAEVKDPDARVSYAVDIGRQKHLVEYARGRWLDGSAETALKRFHVPLAKGAKTVRIKIAGTAVSSDGKATALIGVESLDMCVVDQAKPDHCGVSGRANSSASPGK